MDYGVTLSAPVFSIQLTCSQEMLKLLALRPKCWLQPRNLWPLVVFSLEPAVVMCCGMVTDVHMSVLIFRTDLSSTGVFVLM